MKFRLFISSLFAEYKAVFISYAAVILGCAIVYPTETLESYGLINLKVIGATVIHEPMILYPLIFVIVFFVISFKKSFNINFAYYLRSITAILIFSALTAPLVSLLYTTATTARIASWSVIFMEADRSLFATYPAFWLFTHMPGFINAFVSFIYLNMPSIITLWILFLFIYKRGEHVSRFIAHIFLALAFCFPFWFIFPAISPAQMYLANSLHAPMSEDIARVIQEAPERGLPAELIGKLVHFWTYSNGYAVSTFPSMHTIWGVFLVYSIYYIFRAKKYFPYLVAIAAIIAVANVIGAVYLMQHYAIDILAGIALGILISRIKIGNKKEPA